MPVLTRSSEPLALMFADDGSIPNNPRLPLLVYRGAIDLTGTPDPERIVERAFADHGWGDMWRNGIYPYVHYHSMIHEALAVARGRAKVRFGGAAGEVLDLVGGDVAVLPAGTGHQCLWAAPELCVIGGLSQERQVRPLPRQQGRARQGAREHCQGAAARQRSGARQRRTAAAAVAGVSRPLLAPRQNGDVLAADGPKAHCPPRSSRRRERQHGHAP